MHIITIKCAGGAILVLLTLLTSCQKSTDVVTTTSQDCQLLSELTVLNGNQYTTTTYTYNGNGQLTTSLASSSFSTGTAGNSITYTYTYDAAGNLITANTQGAITNTINVNSTGSYQYTNGRLTKIVSKSSTSSSASDSYSYSYDGSGQLASYTYNSSNPKYGIESYTFVSGLLASGTITRGDQSFTLIVANGRVEGTAYPGGGTTRYTYDARGYLTRSDSFDKAGTLQSYITHEYSTTIFKRASTPYRVVPALNLYGNTELPLSREAVYNADGSLKAETLYQYQVNSKGYITSLKYVQNQTGVGGQGTNVTTYTYSNCP